MPSSKTLQQLLDLNDDVLYPEAVAFMHKMVNEQGFNILPMSQIKGLLNIANTENYGSVEQFIRHQQKRNWPESKKDIKIFYAELEKWFSTMRTTRLRSEFHLVSDKLNAQEMRREVDDLMAVLAQDFIQHLVAENGMLALRRANTRPYDRKR